MIVTESQCAVCVRIAKDFALVFCQIESTLTINIITKYGLPGELVRDGQSGMAESGEPPGKFGSRWGMVKIVISKMDSKNAHFLCKIMDFECIFSSKNDRISVVLGVKSMSKTTYF